MQLNSRWWLSIRIILWRRTVRTAALLQQIVVVLLTMDLEGDRLGRSSCSCPKWISSHHLWCIKIQVVSNRTTDNRSVDGIVLATCSSDSSSRISRTTKMDSSIRIPPKATRTTDGSSSETGRTEICRKWCRLFQSTSAATAQIRFLSGMFLCDLTTNINPILAAHLATSMLSASNTQWIRELVSSDRTRWWLHSGTALHPRGPSSPPVASQSIDKSYLTCVPMMWFPFPVLLVSTLLIQNYDLRVTISFSHISLFPLFLPRSPNWVAFIARIIFPNFHALSQYPISVPFHVHRHMKVQLCSENNKPFIMFNQANEKGIRYACRKKE